MRKFDQSLPMALLRARELTMGYFRPMLNEHGLTEQQWRVIRVLQEYGELEFHKLSRIALIQPPSLTGILTRLERADLVRRTRSRSDQRRLHLSLTPAGLRRFEMVSGVHRGIAVPSSTPEELRQQISDVFAKVNQQPAFREKMTSDGFVVVDIGYAQMPEFMGELQQEFTEAAKSAGMLQ